MSKKKTILFSIGILIIAAGITLFIFMTEPEAQKSGATKKTAMLVEIERAEQGNYTPTIIATGNVQPSVEVMLSPQVSGEIIRISENFVPGGIIEKGELLVQIDPTDYKNNLQLQKSNLMQARADLEIEKGRQNVAERDYQLIQEELPTQKKDLILRQPQLNAVQAQVEAAEASVNQARLNLQRTSLVAPFSGQIITRNANLGSQVAPGANLARIVGTNSYWIIVNLPLSKLSRVEFPTDNNTLGSPVEIVDRKAWEPGVSRTGYLYKLIGSLDQQTRLARAIVVIHDPLALKHPDLPQVILNSFVEVRITGESLEKVVRVSRDHIREDNTVWVMKNHKLNIRETEVIFKDAEYAYITKGIDENDKIVTTNLSSVTDGAALKTKSSEQDKSTDQRTAQQ